MAILNGINNINKFTKKEKDDNKKNQTHFLDLLKDK